MRLSFFIIILYFIPCYECYLNTFLLSPKKQFIKLRSSFNDIDMSLNNKKLYDDYSKFLNNKKNIYNVNTTNVIERQLDNNEKIIRNIKNILKY